MKFQTNKKKTQKLFLKSKLYKHFSVTTIKKAKDSHCFTLEYTHSLMASSLSLLDCFVWFTRKAA